MTNWPLDWRIGKNTSPPFDHLEELNRALDILEEVGPRFDTGKRLELLDEALFIGPRLRRAVGGVTLSWIDGSTRLQQTILKLIPACDVTAEELLGQFDLLRQQKAKLTYAEAYKIKPPVEWLIPNGMVYVKTLNANSITSRLPKAYCYARVSRDWARFFAQLGEAYQRVAELRLRCLTEGRVLCFTEALSGWCLHAPDEWLDGRKRPGSKGAKYLLTSDLPDLLFHKNLSKAEREERLLKARAMRWLYSQYLTLTDQDGRIAKEEALTLIETKFGIRTKKVLEEVWAETPVSDWRKPGRRKKEQIK